jgi:hypothetical protein
MLSERQRRRRCAEIAHSLDAGNLTLWREAEPSLSAGERALVWELRTHVVARAKRAQGLYGKYNKIVASDRYAGGKRTPPTPTVDDDDQDDPLGPSLPEDDDDSPTQEWTTCRACRGLGRLKDGSKCGICGGSGRVPIDDLGDDDDEGDDDDDGAAARGFYGIEED